ncbi:hypothetical protein [Neisseria perflava]|uniref:hypothetical protein n=1 Tax=Neisseria perflava TaxID=33053 RepID=UPI00209CBBA0|nr:hypothetical protein [Neisseria perflava]MCP1660263.1 hypothetical protein [Neisseria perflava]MCP1773326.1 hypothetical protein [Neisseria perflava]
MDKKTVSYLSAAKRYSNATANYRKMRPSRNSRCFPAIIAPFPTEFFPLLVVFLGFCIGFCSLPIFIFAVTPSHLKRSFESSMDSDGLYSMLPVSA